MSELHYLTAAELARLIRAREVSAAEVLVREEHASLARGISRYRSVMRREWPKVPPRNDDDW